MLNLLALYRGNTLRDVRTVSVSSDPKLIKQFVRGLLESSANDEKDPSLKSIANGQRNALQAILNDKEGE